jgi:hypothetical protein
MCRQVLLVSLITVTIGFWSAPEAAGFADLIVKVGDTVGAPGAQNSVISVYMINYIDTVAAYELWLVLSRPDIMEFQTQFDTLYDTAYWRCTTWSGPDCLEWMDVTDSVLGDPSTQYDSIDVTMYEAFIGNHDLSGTRSENWEDVRSRSIGADGHDLKISALANTLVPPYTPGFYPDPEDFDTPMIKILADIYDIPDEWTDREVTIYVQADNPDNFSVSDQHGNSIGVITDTTIDSTCFHCEYWLDDTTCNGWQEVDCDSFELVDSVDCCDTITVGYLDTAYFDIYNGTLRVLGGLCGDCNNDDAVNMLDILFLVAFLYKSGPAPVNSWACDVNGDLGINMLDILALIAFLYKSGPPLECS